MFPVFRPPKFSPLVAIAVCFVCALLWAREKDPFERVRFSLRIAGGKGTTGIAFLSKPVSKQPVVLYLYDSRENLQRSGLRLRQLAELGVAAVGIEYNQTNQPGFDEQFTTLLRYIEKQPWANTNAVAWFGYGTGAHQLLSFTTAHPQIRPRLFICLNGGTSSGGARVDAQVKPTSPGCHFLLVHGHQNEVFPVSRCEELAVSLRGQRIGVDLSILEGKGHHFGNDQDVVYRTIAEYAAAHFGLSGTRSTRSDNSHWAYWIPPLLMVLWFVWWVCSTLLTRCFPAGTELSRTGQAFYVVTAGVALAVLGQTVLHVGLPSRSISPSTAALARRILLRPELREDFDYLVNSPGWSSKPLRLVLQHVELAHLQRKEFYDNLDSATYRECILSPRISGMEASEWGWRRKLWEAFYPRVRKETDPVDAAQIVVRFLRERVGISRERTTGIGVEAAWKRGLTDSEGFDEIYVAALRAVGIAARLDGQGVELWTGEEWMTAPQPLMRVGLPFQAISSEVGSGESLGLGDAPQNEESREN